MYDARYTEFKIGTDISTLNDSLPGFTGELPHNSLATVLYSANTYRKKTGADTQSVWLSFNIQSVILLGTMKDDE